MKKPKCFTILSRRLGAAALAVVMVIGLSACATSGSKTDPGTQKEVSTGSQNDADTSSQNNADTDSQKVTLNLWDAWPGDPQKSLMDSIVKEWNDNNPDIQVTRSTTANDPYKTKIKTAIAADEAPDVFFSWPQGFSKPFVDAGKVVAIDSYITDDIKAQILPGALVQFDGKTYGVCCTQQVGTFFVNTQILSANGLSVPKTFDELVSVSKALSAKNITALCVGEKDLWPGMWYYNQIALREAGPTAVVDALNKKGSFNTEPFIKAADKLKQLVDVGAFGPNALGTSRDESEAAFFSGKMAMYYGLNASGGRIKGSAVDGQIEVHPFPTISDGAGKTSYVGGGAVCFLVSKNTKYEAQAAKFSLYLSQAVSDQFFLTGNALPMWDYSKFDQSKLNPVQLEIMENIAKPADGNVSAWDIFLQGNDAQTHKDLVAEIFGGKMTPEEFAQKMQTALNEQ